MLKRITSALFSAPAGSEIRIVADSQNNNGVKDAVFEYDQVVLRRDPFQGLPGCTFTVGSSTRRFEALVAFDPSAASGARYDLFEVENGVQRPLGESVTNAAGTPVIDFAIRSTEFASVVAAARAARRGARAAGRRKAASAGPKKGKRVAKGGASGRKTSDTSTIARKGIRKAAGARSRKRR